MQYPHVSQIYYYGWPELFCLSYHVLMSSSFQHINGVFSGKQSVLFLRGLAWLLWANLKPLIWQDA